MNWKEEKIVFYDGDCGFCNRSVQFVLENSKDKEILFAALQSSGANSFLRAMLGKSPDLSTFYYYDGKELHQKSTAAMKLAKTFRFPHSALRLLILVPRFMRDFVYDKIAAKRHRLMKGFCVLPSEEDRRRFVI